MNLLALEAFAKRGFPFRHAAPIARHHCSSPGNIAVATDGQRPKSGASKFAHGWDNAANNSNRLYI
ncbi:MAG: hypothetical protein AB7G15_10285, partial [Alphaproteobacteria bacterium]